jgi:hypothetical protein
MHPNTGCRFYKIHHFRFSVILPFGVVGREICRIVRESSVFIKKINAKAVTGAASDTAFFDLTNTWQGKWKKHKSNMKSECHKGLGVRALS